ncbi:hypothetical protein B0H13DRAFT_1855509 [Mycena leptocephala]|nr:hypothetical protein B0H13DRAFT_1855509 [Mycena leptocephala]
MSLRIDGHPARLAARSGSQTTIISANFVNNNFSDRGSHPGAFLVTLNVPTFLASWTVLLALWRGMTLLSDSTGTPLFANGSSKMEAALPPVSPLSVIYAKLANGSPLVLRVQLACVARIYSNLGFLLALGFIDMDAGLFNTRYGCRASVIYHPSGNQKANNLKQSTGIRVHSGDLR